MLRETGWYSGKVLVLKMPRPGHNKIENANKYIHSFTQQRSDGYLVSGTKIFLDIFEDTLSSGESKSSFTLGKDLFFLTFLKDRETVDNLTDSLQASFYQLTIKRTLNRV